MLSKRLPAPERKQRFAMRLNRFTDQLGDAPISISQVDDWIEQGILLPAHLSPKRDCWNTPNLRRAVAANHLRAKGYGRNDEIVIALWLRGEQINSSDLVLALLNEFRRLRRSIIKPAILDKEVGANFKPASKRGIARIERLGPPAPEFVATNVAPGPDFMNMLYEMARYSTDQDNRKLLGYMREIFPPFNLLPANEQNAFVERIADLFKGSLDESHDPERGHSHAPKTPRNDFEKKIIAMCYRPELVEETRQILLSVPALLQSIKTTFYSAFPVEILNMINVLILGLPHWPWPLLGAIMIFADKSNHNPITRVLRNDDLNIVFDFLARDQICD